jgi:hypothetical protein
MARTTTLVGKLHNCLHGPVGIHNIRKNIYTRLQGAGLGWDVITFGFII